MSLRLMLDYCILDSFSYLCVIPHTFYFRAQSCSSCSGSDCVTAEGFQFLAPTTQKNTMRVLRAMQLNKPGKFRFHMFSCLSYVFTYILVVCLFLIYTGF